MSTVADTNRLDAWIWTDTGLKPPGNVTYDPFLPWQPGPGESYSTHTYGLPQTEVYQCPLCRRFFLRANPPVHCLVIHSPGQCCHYGDTEVTVTFSKKRKPRSKK